MKLYVGIKKLNPSAVIPTYACTGDAGMDLTATSVLHNEKYDYYEYHTGLAVAIPEGYVGLIYPRSSNRKTDCYMTNHVGVIDSGYRGEILVCFKSRTAGGAEPYSVGDRIAQLMIVPYPAVEFVECSKLPDSERGEGGHGSTGK